MASSLGKMPTTFRSSLNRAVGALDGVCRADLVPMLSGKGHEGEDVDPGLVEKGCEPGQLGAQLVGDLTP